MLDGLEDFVTTLVVSVVGWTSSGGDARYCAVRNGVLTVTDGREVNVATREAVVGTDVERLHTEVLSRLEQAREDERAERFETTRLHLAAIREITRQLQQARRQEAP
ncbi:MAG: F0F1 ATP synthase subunit epsilon [Gemmatimonadota bacterium]